MPRHAHNKTPEEIEKKVVELYQTFHSPKDIALVCNVSDSSVNKILRRYGIPRNIKTSLAANATQKKCIRCGEVKPIESFRVSRARKYTRQPRCERCEKLAANESLREYRAKNRDKERAKNRAAAKAWRKNNPQYKIAQNLRRRVRELIKNRWESSTRLLGCSYEDFVKHLEQKWLTGMSWGNYGAYKLGQPMTWHIDHIEPCDAFDLTDPEQQKKCFHYTNLRPLWAVDNISRRHKLSV